MKLQRTTLILILLAFGLGGFVYFSEIKETPQGEAAKAKEQKIFSFEEEEIQSLTIKNQGQTLRFERVNQKAGDKANISPWQMKAPRDVPASDPAVSYLLNLLVDRKSNSPEETPGDRTFTAPSSQLQEYGLDKPLATVEVKLKNQQTHQLILGKPDFSGNFLYAQADPPVKTSQQLQVLLVPISFEDAVKRPLSEWQEKENTKQDNSGKSNSKK